MPFNFFQNITPGFAEQDNYGGGAAAPSPDDFLRRLFAGQDQVNVLQQAQPMQQQDFGGNTPAQDSPILSQILAGQQPQVNVLQQAGIDPNIPQPAQVQPQQGAKPRRSILDIIGGISDVLAKVGGAEALYQPTLDARRKFNQDAQTAQLQQQLLQGQGTQFADKHEETLRSQTADVLAGISGQANAAELFEQNAPAGLPPAVKAQISQQLRANPESAPAIARMFGYEPKQQGSLPAGIQIYSAYQRILQTQGKAAADEFLRVAQPTTADIKYLDVGGSYLPVDPITNQPKGAPIPKTETPEGAANRQSREDIAAAALEAKRQHDQEMLEARLGAPVEKIRATFPKVIAAYNSAILGIEQQKKDIQKLIDHPGLAGITGPIQGRIRFSLRDDVNTAQSLYDKIINKGVINELIRIKQSSPTGGAFGSLSNQEGTRLETGLGALSLTQSEDALKDALRQRIIDLDSSEEILKNGFIETRDLIREQRPASPAGNSAPGKIIPNTPRGGRGNAPSGQWGKASVVGG